MIIFDLDGTLADCEHRRHFVDPKKNPEFLPIYAKPFDSINPKTGQIFKPDWKSFYEACDQDKPIGSVIEIFNRLSYDIYGHSNSEIEIWSGRCESVRNKTEKWLKDNVYQGGCYNLKMRPIGDSTPDDQLKEKWLDRYIYESNIENNNCDPVQFVFDDRPKVIRMWRRRGIFVFNCCQHDGEF